MDTISPYIAEEKLKQMWQTQPENMSAPQRELAEAQHACRVENNAAHACDKVLYNTLNACANCLAHVARNKQEKTAA